MMRMTETDKIGVLQGDSRGGWKAIARCAKMSLCFTEKVDSEARLFTNHEDES